MSTSPKLARKPDRTTARGVVLDPQHAPAERRASGRRIAVVIEKRPGFGFGGAQAVGFWTVQALKDEYEVTIVTADVAMSLAEANAFFGTCIRPNEVEIVVVPVPTFMRDRPRLRLMMKHFIARYCRQISTNYDLLISTASEMDLGVRGIQYIHYPLVLSHERSKIRAAYSFLSGAIAGYSHRRMVLNWTLTNSKWTAQKTKDAYGIDAMVLYPPVPDDVPFTPWSDREDGFVCVGRIAAEKNLESVISIIKNVRRRVPGLHLHLIGGSRDQDYWKRFEPLLAAEKDWAFFEGRLPRDEMITLITAHKYGIHGMPEEHFGIGIAEMAKAGCLVFVPRGGGQIEIVQSEELIYDNECDAVRKIARVLERNARHAALRDALIERARGFSSARFMRDMRGVVSKFLASRDAPEEKLER